MRTQKLLANAGLGSRRNIEQRIKSGDILINRETAVLGQTLQEDDIVEVDGTVYKVVTEKSISESRVIIYNKQVGVVTTRKDPEKRPTVFENLPKVQAGRWISVGRLDINTSGLLLLTTDGMLANALMHPSNQVDREYACRVRGNITNDTLSQLRNGVTLEDGVAKFTDISDDGGDGQNHWYHVVLLEGKNREVRRLWEAVGAQVSRLKRVRYGAVFLPSTLKRGQWKEMSSKDVKTLKKDVNLASSPPSLILQAEKSQKLKKPRPSSQRSKRG